MARLWCFTRRTDTFPGIPAYDERRSNLRYIQARPWPHSRFYCSTYNRPFTGITLRTHAHPGLCPGSFPVCGLPDSFIYVVEDPFTQGLPGPQHPDGKCDRYRRGISIGLVDMPAASHTYIAFFRAHTDKTSFAFMSGLSGSIPGRLFPFGMPNSVQRGSLQRSNTASRLAAGLIPGHGVGP